MFDFPIKESYRITQKFGEKLLDYTQFGMLGHNGLDCACARGTGLYAVADGRIGFADGTGAPGGGYGNKIVLIVPVDRPNAFYEVVYGHLLGVAVKTGDMVTKGQLIGFVDSTGFSTGDHLHFGVRIIERRSPALSEVATSYFGSSYVLLDYKNGYLGYIDPLPLFEKVAEDVFEVDGRYGQPYSWAREAAWAIKNEKYAIERCKKALVPYSNRIMKAFVYGYWDADTVFSLGMYALWTTMTKPEYKKRFGL